jgi:hypothetical protein
LALPSLGRALTLSQLETQTRTLIRDTSADTNFQRFSNAQIDAFLNEGLRQLQNDAWLYQGSFNMDLTSGTIEYPLPADYISTVRVTISSMSLTQVSFQGLDGQNGGSYGNGSPGYNWTVAMSTPTEYFIDSFVSGAPSNIGFFANPKFTTSGGVVFVQYVRQVPLLVNKSDIPFNGNSELLPYHDGIADFAAARCWQLLGRPDLTTWLMALYKDRAAQARANINRQPNFQPGASGDRGPRQ